MRYATDLLVDDHFALGAGFQPAYRQFFGRNNFGLMFFS